MSVYQIFYQGGAKMMRPISSRAEYMALRDSEQNRRADKKHLVQMNYSCLPNNEKSLNQNENDNEKSLNEKGNQNEKGGCGPLKGSTRESNSVGMDIDLSSDDWAVEREKRTIRDQILAKKEELGLLMLEESYSKGYHIVFRRRTDLSQVDNLRWASSLLGVEFDKGAKDITRVFFTPAADKLIFLSEEIFVNAAAERVNTPAGRVNTLGEGGNTAKGGVNTSADGLVLNTPSSRVNAPEGCGNTADGCVNTSAAGLVLDPADVGESNTTEGSINAEGINMSEANINTSETSIPTYNGFTFDAIISKYWSLFYDGKEPCEGNRNTLTFELAMMLRHICGFDREKLNQVIPDYWESSSLPREGRGGVTAGRVSEKMACIDSALSEKRTQMPKRLKDVLAALRAEKDPNENLNENDNEGGSENQNVAFAPDLSRITLPMGIRDSVESAPEGLGMPVLTAICPVIGMLATGVRLDVHGTVRGLNLIAYVAGDFASGKGSIDPVVKAWTDEVHDMDKMYLMQEDEWRAKKRAAKNKKEQPEEPKLPIRLLTLNNTVANLAERLANTDGRHAFSFTPEADTVAQKWRSAMSDFSVMLRQAYDGTGYDREARSADAVTVHIDHLLWNVTLCGTPDALYRVVNNYTDGFQSRLAIARTPDNTFSPLEDNPRVMSDLQREHIRQVAHLLPLLAGDVTLPKLEERGRLWLERIRLETMKNDDRVRARQRFRICVTAQRMTCCVMLCHVVERLIKVHGLASAEKMLKQKPDLWRGLLLKAQTPRLLDAYDVIADSLLDNALYFFRDRIECAFSSRDYAGTSERVRPGKNDSIFERLDNSFSVEQAYQQTFAVKGAAVSRNQVHMMLKNWRRQGLVSLLENGSYRKCQDCVGH